MHPSIISLIITRGNIPNKGNCLKNGRKKIGLLIDRFYYRIPVDIYHGVLMAVKDLDFELSVFSGCIINSADPDKRQSNIIYQLAQDRELDGIIIASSIIANEINKDELKEFCLQYSGLPVISLGLAVEGIPGIILDNHAGMYSVVEHLIQRHGKNKIVFIKGPENNVDAEERLSAYLNALKNNKIDIDESLILPGNFQENTAAETMNNFVFRKKKKPGIDFDCVVGVNDFTARGALLELQRAAVSIPERVAVAGFDDVYSMKYLSPSLTSVCVPFAQMGETAGHILAEHFSGKKLSDIYRIRTEPVFRESCGCILTQEGSSVKHKEGAAAVGKTRKDLLYSIKKNINAEKKMNKGDTFNFDFYSELWETLDESAENSFQRLIIKKFYIRLGQNLSSAVKISEITDILKTHLPLIGIRQCCLVLYEPPPHCVFPQKLPVKSRLVMAIDNDNTFDVPDEGILFDTMEILPERIKNEFNMMSVIIEALFFREEQFGYIIFSGNVEYEVLYSEIRLLVSGALQAALMFVKIESNEIHLKQANEQINLLNEKLNEENLQMRAEMKIAEMIQTALLPKNLENIHQDFDVCGKMAPADEVGGDFFDIIRTSDDCFWIGIGDVSGHGVTPGLIMMMAQTMHSLITMNFDVTPKDVLGMMNGILSENIGNRLEEKNFMSFTSFKYLGGGRFIHAGLHQDVVVYRKKTKQCEYIPTNGTWLNLMADISEVTVNAELQMDSGDIMVLYTDGFSELFNEEKEMLGIERIGEFVEKSASQSAEKLVQTVFNKAMAWSGGKYADDMTLLVLKME